MIATIWIIGYVISFPVVALAIIKWVARLSGFDSLGDIAFVIGESFLCSLLWPLTLPLAILYLLDVPEKLDRRSTRLYSFLNSTFGKKDK
jgi:hypothetical protein